MDTVSSSRTSASKVYILTARSSAALSLRANMAIICAVVPLSQLLPSVQRSMRTRHVAAICRPCPPTPIASVTTHET